MRQVWNTAVWILSVLLCTALMLSPLAAIDATAMPVERGTHHSTMTEASPCDMPCEGCGDRDQPLSCISACMGLIAAIPTFESSPVLHPLSSRTAVDLQHVLVGTLREPDTPPPKFVLA